MSKLTTAVKRPLLQTCTQTMHGTRSCFPAPGPGRLSLDVQSRACIWQRLIICRRPRVATLMEFARTARAPSEPVPARMESCGKEGRRINLRPAQSRAEHDALTTQQPSPGGGKMGCKGSALICEPALICTQERGASRCHGPDAASSSYFIAHHPDVSTESILSPS